MTKYKHESVYFKDEDKSLLDTLKEEANKNNLSFSDYVKELIKVGREKGVYDLPESVKIIDQSGKIKDLEIQIEKFRNDIGRLTALKDANFDWNSILEILKTDNYITERQILQKLGKIKKSLFTDEYNEEHIELLIADLQQKLCLRADYYQDVEYKKNQGWKKCNH
jgi:hypothetical protein